MADATGVQQEFDVGINGKGYLLAWEMQTPFAPLRSTETYRKLHKDTAMDERAFSEDLSENKLDGLKRSGQRSFYNGQGQRRLDNPKVSDDEMFLRGKNLDTFNERGALTMSHAISRSIAGVGGGSQPSGRCTASASYLYWACPAGTPTNTIVKSINAWGDAGTSRTLDANWTAGMTCRGMTNDGANVYVAGSGGIWRGALSAQSTELARWSTLALQDIAFVKERILGHVTSGGLAQVWEIDTTTGTSQQVGANYPAGFVMNSSSGAARIFAEVGGYACWVATAGQDGYLYTWDGENEPVKAARFPGFQAWGVISYAEQTLYVLGRDPAGAPHGDRWCVIACTISASGQATFDILHIVNNDMVPVATVQGTEILFPVMLGADDWDGLTSDNNVVSNEAATVAALNVVNSGVNLGKHWGRINVSVPSAPTVDGPTWGDSGFTLPDICVFRNSLTLVGQNGEVRTEQTSYPPVAELVSSAIDFNLDCDKVFTLGEVGTDPVPTGSTVVLAYTSQDPDFETETWNTIVTLSAGDKTGRERLAAAGVKTPFVHYKLTLNGGSNTPTVRKASIAASYGLKPKAEHLLSVKAFSGMQLRNGAPWPVDRTPDNVQAELEALYASQEHVDYQENAVGEASARSSVKVRVADLDVRKLHVEKMGFGVQIGVRLVEIPD